MNFVTRYIFKILKITLLVNSVIYKVPLISDIDFMNHQVHFNRGD